MREFDVVLLTDRRWVRGPGEDAYSRNIHEEDRLLRSALEQLGCRVHRCAWDDPQFDWTRTRTAVFRTTWDYFERFAEFDAWLGKTSALTHFINPLELVRWNLDKHYLADLEKAGLRIPPTRFIERGETRSLSDLTAAAAWPECVLKPAVSGAARHTYRFVAEEAARYEAIYRRLVAEESMLLQRYQPSITERGEAALMYFGGRYSHAVLKRAKPGDFRVQDDFGGTLHDWEPNRGEIELAAAALAVCTSVPAYARVDLMWDTEGLPCISELELIEPELWLRRHPVAAEAMAEALIESLSESPG